MKYFYLFIFIFLYKASSAQERLDQRLNPIVDTLARSLKEHDSDKKVGIAYIVNTTNHSTELSESLTSSIIRRLFTNRIKIVDRSLEQQFTRGEKGKAGLNEVDIDQTIAN